MKILVGVLAALCVLGLIGGIVYVLLFMEDAPAAAPASEPADSQAAEQRRLNVKKNAETPADVLESLDYEIAANPDTVGWIEIPGTEINNSVVQSHSNNVYLRANERKEYDVYGCYFVDYECSVGGREELSANTIIYGHSDLKDNPDGPRFSQLFKFTDPEFARNTPVIRFSTLDGFMDWEIFAVFYADVRNFYFIGANPPEGIDTIANTAMEKSLYDYGITVGPQDNILTLSTCTIKYGVDDTDHRFVIMARLLGEDEQVPTAAEIELRTPTE